MKNPSSTAAVAKIAGIVARERGSVFTASLPGYDSTSTAYLAELATATGSEFKRLAAELVSCVVEYQENPKLAHVPPTLPRFPGETASECVGRCYAAGGPGGYQSAGGCPLGGVDPQSRQNGRFPAIGAGRRGKQ